jgi:chromosomal replication initiator protein
MADTCTIRTHSTQGFRTKYRETDVLLVDDIQFIAGKESTQEEFFHTFNTLHGQNKQIVITSDRPPKAFNTLEERLYSRFQWGLTVDVQIPELETRIAILQSKSERLGTAIPNKYLELIAHRIQSNIRELEGALTRVSAFADLSGHPLSPELVESALADFLPQQHAVVQPEEIIEYVASTFNVTTERISSKDRSHKVALPRQIAMYLLRKEAHLSLPEIGNMLGGRDHTTVMYGCDKIEDLLERDDHIRQQVGNIRNQLFNTNKITVLQ